MNKIFSLTLLFLISCNQNGYKTSQSKSTHLEKSPKCSFQTIQIDDWLNINSKRISFKKDKNGKNVSVTFTKKVTLTANLGGSELYKCNCEKAIYNYKRKSLTLIGWPRAEIGDSVSKADSSYTTMTFQNKHLFINGPVINE